MEITTLEAYPPPTREAVLGALTLAFSRDPVMRFMYPDPDAYLRHFPHFAAAFGGPAFEAGTVWAASDFSGAALWLPSGVHSDGDAIEEVLARSVDPAKLETIGLVLERMAELHPEEPHWYLAIVGVDAAHQGRGLGAKLLEGALARCDAEGLVAYLESSNPANISLYERHGFRVMAEIREGDAPVVTPMLRPAAR